jgi:hypothetical protein
MWENTSRPQADERRDEEKAFSEVMMRLVVVSGRDHRGAAMFTSVPASAIVVSLGANGAAYPMLGHNELGRASWQGNVAVINA